MSLRYSKGRNGNVVVGWCFLFAVVQLTAPASATWSQQEAAMIEISMEASSATQTYGSGPYEHHDKTPTHEQLKLNQNKNKKHSRKKQQQQQHHSNSDSAVLPEKTKGQKSHTAKKTEQNSVKKSTIPATLTLTSPVPMNHSLTAFGDIGVFVIALKERVAHVSSFLSTTGLQPHSKIQPAVLKQSFTLDQLEEEGRYIRHAGLSEGEVACSLSHREVLLDFLNNPSLEYAMVFEDDAVMSKALKILTKVRKNQNLDSPKVKHIIERLSKTSKTSGWHALNLGRCFDVCRLGKEGYELVEKLNNSLRIVKTCSSLCTHAYMITREGAEILLDYTLPIRDAEDRVRNGMTAHDVWNYYSVQPRLFDQQFDDVENMIHSVNKGQHLPECQGHYHHCEMYLATNIGPRGNIVEDRGHINGTFLGHVSHRHKRRHTTHSHEDRVTAHLNSKTSTEHKSESK